MSMQSEVGITAEQYHVGLNKLWSALGIKGVQKADVFTLVEERLRDGYYLGNEFLEEERHIALEELEEYDSINDYVTSPEMYDHEALDRTFIVSNMICEYLLTHPTILSDAKLYRLAAIAQSALASLYGEIGRLSLSDKELKGEPF